jgi:hypothetical protein
MVFLLVSYIFGFALFPHRAGAAMMLFTLRKATAGNLFDHPPRFIHYIGDFTH